MDMTVVNEIDLLHKKLKQVFAVVNESVSCVSFAPPSSKTPLVIVPDHDFISRVADMWAAHQFVCPLYIERNIKTGDYVLWAKTPDGRGYEGRDHVLRIAKDDVGRIGEWKVDKKENEKPLPQFKGMEVGMFFAGLVQNEILHNLSLDLCSVKDEAVPPKAKKTPILKDQYKKG